MKNLPSALIVAATLATGLMPHAQTFQQSLAAAERGDDRVAFLGFKKLAELGDIKSQGKMGLMYRNGLGVAKDDQQALNWYLKAAI